MQPNDKKEKRQNEHHQIVKEKVELVKRRIDQNIDVFKRLAKK
ncbi:MAG: hypothetical protein E7E70_24910 [Escherichia coli]|nr:hypothetical protein [Escherichia coli]